MQPTERAPNASATTNLRAEVMDGSLLASLSIIHICSTSEVVTVGTQVIQFTTVVGVANEMLRMGSFGLVGIDADEQWASSVPMKPDSRSSAQREKAMRNTDMTQYA
jgi:hypothetical protein